MPVNTLSTIHFIFPWVLWALLLLPLLAFWLLVVQRHWWLTAFQFSQVAALDNLKRHPLVVLKQRWVPLWLLGVLLSLIIGLAGPAVLQATLNYQTPLILAFDISKSMMAADIKPNRLAAAKQAAQQFIQALPDEVDLGLVFFAGNTYVMSPLTQDHAKLASFFANLTPSQLKEGTAIGDAITTSIDTLALKPITGQQPQASLILVTDGENNIGLDPHLALQKALNYRVRLYTVGVGASEGAFILDGIYTRLDESTLKALAKSTGGYYYRVKQFRDFAPIYQQITQRALGVIHKRQSLQWLCLLGALGCAMMALAGPLWLRQF